MKRYIQNPWKASDSPYYKHLRNSPPEGVDYTNAKHFKIIQNKYKLKLNVWLKHYGKTLIRKIYPSLINAHFTKNSEKYDLIHCAHCISRNKKPWVADIEYSGQFWISGSMEDNMPKSEVRNFLKSPYCKKILP